ncbi:MAG: hypothetical protein Fur005_33690 [Roseiflexaceae bacterium]
MSSVPFSLGVTYLPRRSGYRWLEVPDRSELRDELAQIADIGCDTIRIALIWEAFQPSPERIGGRAMHALEQALDAAQIANLRVVPLLFPVALDGTLWLPAWANGPSLLDELSGTAGIGPTITIAAAQGPAVFVEGSYRANRARDLFSYRPTLRAQRFLIDQVVGYFGQHPAIWAWQLGEGLERVRRPASAEESRAWYQSMADQLRSRRPNAQVLGVTNLNNMSRKAGPRPEDLAASCDLLGVSGDPPEPVGPSNRHTTFISFCHAVAAGLAQRQVLVASLGMPTIEQRGGGWVNEQVYGRQRQIFYADQEQQATFLETAIDRLMRAGAAGVWLSSYADQPSERWSSAPFDLHPRTRTQGIIDGAGREKRAVVALRDLARRRMDPPTPQPPQTLDPERHWYNPSHSIRELWRGFEAG